MSNQKEDEGNSEPPESSDKDKPKIYGDYEILKAIGKGKFAVVYRAQKISDGQIVALKRISVDMIDDKARDKCLKEVGLLQSLDHPNIIRYMDSFINENNLVIVVEWAAAGDLKRQLRKAQERQTGFDERIIWKYFSQIADAIQHMHERRIMHRDLKPANIFLTLDGTVKVGDLGLSRELSENTYQAHSKVGTPLYMSPEVLRGDGYDFKSDIWSIGCLLYELAMLKSPFKSEGLNLYSLFQKISQGEYSPLPERYSEELKTLTYAMISTNPEDRPDIADICREARAMRAKYNEEYLKKKQQQQQQQKKEQEDEDGRSESHSSTRQGGAKESKSDDSPKSTVSKTTVNSSSRSPGDGGADADSLPARRRSADKKRSGGPGVWDDSDGDDTAGEGDVGGGKQSSARGGEAAGHSSSHRRRGSNESLDSTATDDRRSKAKRSNLSVDGGEGDGDSYGNRRRDRVNGDGNREDGPGHGEHYKTPPGEYSTGQHPMDNFSGDKTVKKNATAANRQKPSSLRPSRTADDDSPEEFIPYTKPTGDTSYQRKKPSSSSPKKPQAAVQRRKKEEGGTASSGGLNTSRQGGAGHMSRRNLSGGQEGRTTLNFDDDEDDNLDQDDGEGINDKMSKATNSKLANSCGAFALMDIVYGKLLALGYPMYTEDAGSGGAGTGICKITPMHFAIEGASLFGRAKSSFPSTQFGSFVEVCLWLVGEANGTGSYGGHIDIDSDPPATIVRQLLRFAQECGVDAKSLAEVTPASLQQGHGEKACILLNLLSDAVAKKRVNLWKPFVYPEEEVVAGGDLVEDEDDDDIVEEYTGEGKDGAEYPADMEESVSAVGGRNLQMSMIIPTVDSSKWKEETERVAPLLRNAMKSHKSSSSWMSHVEMMQEHGNKVLQQDSSSPATKSGNDASMSSYEIIDMLSTIQHNLLKDLSGIARTEKLINVNPEMCSLGLSYAKIKQELESLEERMQKTTASNSDKLAVIQESINELTEQIDAKTGEDGEDGTNGMVRLKRGIKAIKEDIRHMGIRSSMLQNEIWALKQADVAARRKKAVEKGKSRSRKKGKKSDSIFSED